jgi:Leucine-rich repeat (LRR) protein
MLTRLHLANNNLSNLEGNFKGLFNLTFLNLRGNQISHVDGLEDLALLETLHLDKQNLSEDQELSFDPTSLISLSV